MLHQFEGEKTERPQRATDGMALSHEGDGEAVEKNRNEQREKKTQRKNRGVGGVEGERLGENERARWGKERERSLLSSEFI